MQCTNPACETWINVPEGAQQVICQNCNTWHFPSAIEEVSGSNSGNDMSAYEMPNLAVEPPAVVQDFQAAPETYDNEKKIDDAQTAVNDPLDDQFVGFLITATGERMGLKIGKNVLGRKDCDLIINDRKVSRRHCVVEVTSDENGAVDFTIYDIGHLDGTSSTNGVYVSGRSQRLQDYERITIRNGSSIHIGDVHLNLKITPNVG